MRVDVWPPAPCLCHMAGGTFPAAQCSPLRGCKRQQERVCPGVRDEGESLRCAREGGRRTLRESQLWHLPSINTAQRVSEHAQARTGRRPRDVPLRSLLTAPRAQAAPAGLRSHCASGHSGVRAAFVCLLRCVVLVVHFPPRARASYAAAPPRVSTRAARTVPQTRSAVPPACRGDAPRTSMHRGARRCKATATRTAHCIDRRTSPTAILHARPLTAPLRISDAAKCYKHETTAHTYGRPKNKHRPQVHACFLSPTLRHAVCLRAFWLVTVAAGEQWGRCPPAPLAASLSSLCPLVPSLSACSALLVCCCCRVLRWPRRGAWSVESAACGSGCHCGWRVAH